MFTRVQRRCSGNSQRKGAAGFTLIEVLITLVILSIGSLGVASLQFGSLKGNQSAFHSSIATALAAEGADRIRANLPGVAQSQYNLIYSKGTDVSCISDSGCSYENVAKHDAYEWIKSIEDQLPGGQGVICKDSTPYDGISSAPDAAACDGESDANGLSIFAIKVWWDDDRDPATPRMAYRISVVP